MKNQLIALSLCLCSVGSFGQILFGKNHHFNPNTYPEYTNEASSKSIELINSNEIMTVGYVKEFGFNSKHDILLTKVDAVTGAVIWTKKYGQPGVDEKAFGLTLGFDGQHIIVAGTVEGIGSEFRLTRAALAMKVNTSTGKVVWATECGQLHEDQEFRMVERNSGSPSTSQSQVPFMYTLVGSSTILNGASKVIYAACIFDFNGAQHWGRVYRTFLSSQIPGHSDVPTTMVRNEQDNLIITGTRYELNSFSKIFTIGIDASSGSLSDKYVRYAISDRNSYAGGICNVKVGSTTSYGLVFTTQSPKLKVKGINEAVTVIHLDQACKPINSRYYWVPGRSKNQGLSIFQSKVNDNDFFVYLNSKNNTNNPGILRTNLNGNTVSYIHMDVADKKGTYMLQTSAGYFFKATAQGFQNGFLFNRSLNDGRSFCSYTDGIDDYDVTVSNSSYPYTAQLFGDDSKREVTLVNIPTSTTECTFSGGASLREASEASGDATAADFFKVFPSPISENQSTVQLQYRIENQQVVTIQLFNALGQRVLEEQRTLKSGENQLSLDSQVLSSGINLMVISSADGVLFSTKLLKQ